MEDKKYHIPEAICYLSYGKALFSPTAITGPEDAVELIKAELKKLDREYIMVLNLNNKNKVINYSVVSVGGINRSIAEISNVFKTAILSNAKSIIVLHNHPSGELEISREDITTSKRIKQAGDILGITLLDSICVAAGSDTHLSLKEKMPELFNFNTEELFFNGGK